MALSPKATIRYISIIIKQHDRSSTLIETTALGQGHCKKITQGPLEQELLIVNRIWTERGKTERVSTDTKTQDMELYGKSV